MSDVRSMSPSSIIFIPQIFYSSFNRLITNYSISVILNPSRFLFQRVIRRFGKTLDLSDFQLSFYSSSNVNFTSLPSEELTILVLFTTCWASLFYFFPTKQTRSVLSVRVTDKCLIYSRPLSKSMNLKGLISAKNIV